MSTLFLLRFVFLALLLGAVAWLAWLAWSEDRRG